MLKWEEIDVKPDGTPTTALCNVNDKLVLLLEDTGEGALLTIKYHDDRTQHRATFTRKTEFDIMAPVTQNWAMGKAAGYLDGLSDDTTDAATILYDELAERAVHDANSNSEDDEKESTPLGTAAKICILLACAIVFAILVVHAYNTRETSPVIGDPLKFEYNALVPEHLQVESSEELKNLLPYYSLSAEEYAYLAIFKDKYGINEFPLRNRPDLGFHHYTTAAHLIWRLQQLDKYVEQNNIPVETVSEKLNAIFAQENLDLVYLIEHDLP